MRPTSIPDEEVWEGSQRLVIAPPDGDLTNDDIRPVEALVDATNLGKRFSMRCMPEEDEASRIAEGAPIWVEFLGEQIHPFLVEVGQPPVAGDQHLRVSVSYDETTGIPVFEAFIVGVDTEAVSDFVEGCVEALQKMLQSGLTPPDPT